MIYSFKHRGEERLYNTFLKGFSGKSQSGCEGSYRVATGDNCEVDRRCLSPMMCPAVSSVDHFNRKKSFSLI